jgi:hypothetical protein
MEFELRAYIEDRRAELKERRRAAAKRTRVWAADCAIHELDRIEGWLNLSQQGERAGHLARETDAEATTQAVLELER